ncbi:heterokaryon incompatibility protein-domain-containing protein [Xylogone sp. PMI_703]|nr:heterokaryon incompatibility protein-domain-containing protein [Xylogone sp. PMI_703]
MWLLNVDTFCLEFFHGPDQVRYAILSHTWEKEEVIYQDMSNLSLARQKSGWYKIEMTCNTARDASLKYAWIDTCCIDKSSSAELSEAINSMYDWYKQSTICYAYLCDLPDSADNPHSPMEYLRKSRWFTRGWTLQELIAPRNIVFYNASWSIVGSKHRYVPILAKVTGVDVSVLEDTGHLVDIPVGRKISWAAKRVTTRIEDNAYSLLGILNVNMPLLYGEGHKAFIRLQEEVVKISNDLSLFAWQSSREPRKSLKYSGIFAHFPSEFETAPIFLDAQHTLITS